METEDWALVISIISLFISLYSLYQNKVINCTNLQADYYKKIFEKYLLKEIPIAVNLISFNDIGKLHDDYKEVSKVLIRMLEECRYFVYANKSFYQKLRNKVTDLDDKLIDVNITTKNEQDAFIYTIHQDIQSMFRLINKSYMS